MDCSPSGHKESDTTERLHVFICDLRGFPGGAEVKASAMWETWVRSLGREDPLQKGTTTHSSVLAWRIPMDRRAWRATVHGVAKSQTRLSTTAIRLYSP